jgi:magnesium chelatase family protein
MSAPVARHAAIHGLIRGKEPSTLASVSAIARIQTFAFSGIEAVPVEVQVQIAPGLPAFLVVGLPDKAVGESRERVRAVLTALGLSLPPKRVLVNLAPADLAKEGSHFDLPIALAVLAAMEVIPRDAVAEFAALGELALDGTLAPVAGVLPAAIAAGARELGLVCPFAQGPEAAWAGTVEVLAPPDLPALINHFQGRQLLTAPEPPPLEAETWRGADLAEVRGQESAKRALEIAAAGALNLLMVGPPGSGKSMLAARLPGLLPELTPAEALEVSLVHSVAGMLQGGKLLRRPPFRDPHHSAGTARSRARSAWRISACCSSTSGRNSPAPRWRRCASRWRPGGRRSAGPMRMSPIPRASSASPR